MYKNKHKGERCFIVCNGPSLTKKDLKKLENETTFGTNRIYMSGFIPTYYAVEDHLVVEDSASEIDALKCVKFIPKNLAYHFKQPAEFIDMKFEYDYEDFPNFGEDADDCVWSGGTVTYMCLQLAFWMGFSEVYLIGLDHDYQIPSDAKEVQPLVYLSQSDDPNHFDPAYFGKGKRFHDPNPKRMELAYAKAKAVYGKHRRTVANVSRKSKLKIFKRARFDDLFTAS